jgi:hypothetical protein
MSGTESANATAGWGLVGVLLITGMSIMLMQKCEADKVHPTPSPSVSVAASCEPLCNHHPYRPASGSLTSGEPLPATLAAGMAVDEPSRDWAACRIVYGDTSVIYCPDGAAFAS